MMQIMKWTGFFSALIFLTAMTFSGASDPWDLDVIDLMDSNVCPGGRVQCGGNQTCCPLSRGGDYGCCNYPYAVCCNDYRSCCPAGYTCNLYAHSCVRNRTITTTKSKGQPWTRLDERPTFNPLNNDLDQDWKSDLSWEDVPCPDGRSCPDSTTCCSSATTGYGCCPFENAVCCKDGVHCCPAGSSCDLTLGRCNRND